MKKTANLILLTLLLAASLPAALSAQTGSVAGKAYYLDRSRGSGLIDWMPVEQDGRRYTVALRPFYLINSGLKADFEFELRQPGQWLQFELIGRYKGWYDPMPEETHYGWESIEAAKNRFQRMEGGGFGVAFKTFFRPNGWYFSAGVVFNYYGVWYDGYTYVSFEEEGSSYLKREAGVIRADYYKPGFNFNIGKHFALTRNLFFDAYVGVGYAYSFYDSRHRFAFDGTNPFTFAYRGLLVSGGFRIGWPVGRCFARMGVERRFGHESTGGPRAACLVSGRDEGYKACLIKLMMYSRWSLLETLIP